MNDTPRTLRSVLNRIEELIAAGGHPREDVLDVARLSHATGLSRPVVELLLAGGTPPGERPEDMVRRRVRFLYETRTRPEDRVRVVKEIAEATGTTETWVRKLMAGESKPSITAGPVLTRHYGVAATFLTDSPEEALLRELQLVRVDLEAETDPGKVLRELGVVHMSGRGAGASRSDLAALARMVADMSRNLDAVRAAVDNLTTDPEGRKQ
ncbi:MULTISPECIES: hypothetical protein [Streptomyces]|uniref:Transcriptional regulator n=1 Tax=Streptomyces doudnae TaxID=3075536 RepID=A0ABD5EGZ8_9ACTN|nr:MULTISPECIES: hypothetical protein [unclassified Streptomyces]MDT0433888.1 hypothetical protein [Streptomyces sp. DSM 41981]MYQ64682.1 hypothetical protein [Streptomyces sp. SID4950]SCD84044.1 hypothetical protein GA0115242_115737 [Streptomyces sp. SolWspMP-5a-2]